MPGPAGALLSTTFPRVSQLPTLVTATSGTARPLYAGSADAADDVTTVYPTLPSLTASGTPVTVTVLGFAASNGVNTSEAGPTVPSFGLLLASAIWTFAF